MLRPRDRRASDLIGALIEASRTPVRRYATGWWIGQPDKSPAPAGVAQQLGEVARQEPSEALRRRPASRWLPD